MSGFPPPLSAPGVPAGAPRSPTKPTSSQVPDSGFDIRGLRNRTNLGNGPLKPPPYVPRPIEEVIRARRFPRSMTMPIPPPIGPGTSLQNAGQLSLRKARKELMAREGYPIPPQPPTGFDIYRDEQSLQARSQQAQHRTEEARDFWFGNPSAPTQPPNVNSNKRPWEVTNDRHIGNFLNSVPESLMVPAVDFVMLHQKAWFWDQFAGAQQRAVAKQNSGAYRPPNAEAYQPAKPAAGREGLPSLGNLYLAQAAGLGRAATSNNWRANAAASSSVTPPVATSSTVGPRPGIERMGNFGSTNLIRSMGNFTLGNTGNGSNAGLGGITRSSTMGPMGTFAVPQPATSRRPLRDVADWRRAREAAKNTNSDAEADGKENVKPPHVHMVHPPTTIPVATAQPAGQQPPPPNRTLIISPIPSSIRLADLTYSVLAPGGLDWIHYSPVNPVLPSNQSGANPQDPIPIRPPPLVATLQTSPAPVNALSALARTSPLASLAPPHQQSAEVEQPMALIVTFANQVGAEQFKSYTDKHGIWVSVQHPQRGPADYKMEIEGVEYPVFKESHRGILYAKKRILGAGVRFWGKDGDGSMLPQDGDIFKGMEGMLLQWFKMEDCAGIQEAREAGATRVIEVLGDSGTIERKITAMKCSIEFIKITSGGGSPVSTYLRFHSLRDAVRAAHALRVNGYAPVYARDAADKPVASAKWRQYHMAAEKALADKKKKDLCDIVMDDD